MFPSLGFGLGLRAPHYNDVLAGRSSVSWFEVISENFMSDGGRPLHNLEKVRSDFPIVLHGVSLSIGSVDPLNLGYLKKLKNLANRFQPAIISDHLCWTGVQGENLHDLLPLPYTEESLAHVVERITKVQDYLGRRMLIENVSSYLEFAHSELTEWDFLAEVARRADCGILPDINNIYVSAVNHGFDPLTYLEKLPRNRVGQIHLAGHSINKTEDGKTYLIDTHDNPVCEEVWTLYSHSLERFGDVSTMIEWDADLPDYQTLESELDKARMHSLVQKNSPKIQILSPHDRI